MKPPSFHNAQLIGRKKQKDMNQAYGPTEGNMAIQSTKGNLIKVGQRGFARLVRGGQQKNLNVLNN